MPLVVRRWLCLVWFHEKLHNKCWMGNEDNLLGKLIHQLGSVVDVVFCAFFLIWRKALTWFLDLIRLWYKAFRQWLIIFSWLTKFTANTDCGFLRQPVYVFYRLSPLVNCFWLHRQVRGSSLEKKGSLRNVWRCWEEREKEERKLTRRFYLNARMCTYHLQPQLAASRRCRLLHLKNS